MTFMHKATSISAIVWLSIASATQVCAQAQQTRADTTSQQQNPDQFDSVQAEIGNTTTQNNGTQNAFYYNLNYKNNQIIKNGTPPSFSNPNQPITAPDPAKAGDTSNFAVRLDSSGLSTDTGLYNVLGIQPFKNNASILDALHLRGAVQFAGRFDGKEYTQAVGLETEPVHPITLLNKKTWLTNWLIFGANGGQQKAEGIVSNDNYKATYRSFIGRGFGWVRSKSFTDRLADAAYKLAKTPDAAVKNGQAVHDSGTAPDAQSPVQKVLVYLRDQLNPPGALDAAKKLSPNDWRTQVNMAAEEVQPDLENQAVKAFPTLALAKTYHDQYAASPGTALPTAIQSIVYTLVNDFSNTLSADNWQDQLRQAVRDYEMPADHPTAALWLEDSGWYTIHGVPTGQRFASLFAATATWWVDPSVPERLWLRARYENGRDAAEPSGYKDMLAVSVGTSF